MRKFTNYGCDVYWIVRLDCIRLVKFVPNAFLIFKCVVDKFYICVFYKKKFQINLNTDIYVELRLELLANEYWHHIINKVCVPHSIISVSRQEHTPLISPEFDSTS